MSDSQAKNSFWSRPAVKWGGTVLLGLLFVLSYLIYMAADLVSNDLLDPELYISALDENDIYKRIYAELLADPALREVDALISGSIEFGPEMSTSPVSLATSTLGLVLPPSTVKGLVEGVITRLTDYLSGETDRLEPRLDISSRLKEGTAADAIMAKLQAELPELIAQDDALAAEGVAIAEESRLADYAQGLANGVLGALPAEVASARTDQLSEEQRGRLADTLLGPSADSVPATIRAQMDTALAANDMSSAIALATSALLRPRVENAVSELKDKIKGSGVDDTVISLALFLEETEENVLGRLNTIRDLMFVLNQRIIPLTFIVMALSLIGIVLLHGHGLQDVLRSTGLTLLVAGILAFLIWWILGQVVQSGLEERFASSTSPLPEALKLMIQDVVNTIRAEVWRSIWTTALIPVVSGLLLLLFSFILRESQAIGHFFGGLWSDHKLLVGAGILLIIMVPLILRAAFREGHEAERACNGHVKLCDRRLNEVALATTHNSMSISQYGWVWPSHDGTLTNQLDAGVRGLLIDTHYWDDEAFIESYLDALPDNVRPAAEKALDILDLPAQEGQFLCHNLCGFGVTQLAEGLAEIRVFLEENPREVVVIIIQDAITPEDTETAFEESGLISTVYTHEEGQPWPTLGEMIDMNQRVVVMAEEQGPPPDWYLNVWDYTKETPYSFHHPDELSCEPNRGNEEGEFFLLNHWIERASPSRVDSAQMNEYQFLLNRAQECAEERGQIPNFVAVNFYLNGDLFDVDDDLNGVRSREGG